MYVYIYIIYIYIYILAGNYMFKVNNKDTRKTPWRRSGLFIVNFEYISHFVLVFLWSIVLLTLSR